MATVCCCRRSSCLPWWLLCSSTSSSCRLSSFSISTCTLALSLIPESQVLWYALPLQNTPALGRKLWRRLGPFNIWVACGHFPHKVLSYIDSLHAYLAIDDPWTKLQLYTLIHVSTHVTRHAALTLLNLDGHATSQQACISVGAHEHVGLSSEDTLPVKAIL